MNEEQIRQIAIDFREGKGLPRPLKTFSKQELLFLLKYHRLTGAGLVVGVMAELLLNINDMQSSDEEPIMYEDDDE